MTSLKKNIFWNSVRVGSNLVFPLVTFPYVSRVLGPDTIGLFNYVTAIAAYFTLFASLGFPIYGVREIANVKDKLEEFGNIVNSIFTANVIATFIVYLAYSVVALLISGEYLLLYFIIYLYINYLNVSIYNYIHFTSIKNHSFLFAYVLSIAYFWNRKRKHSIQYSIIQS